MYSSDAYTELNEFERNILKLAISDHIEELIPDEQIERVLQPVRSRINSGEFSRPNRRKRIQRPIIFTLAAAGVAAALIFTFTFSGQTFVEVQDPTIPLAAELPGESPAGIVTVVNEQTSETLEMTENIESVLSDGTWKIIITADGESTEVARLIIENGVTRLVK